MSCSAGVFACWRDVQRRFLLLFLCCVGLPLGFGRPFLPDCVEE